MIPVVMERRMMDSSKWDGPVGMTLGVAHFSTSLTHPDLKLRQNIQIKRALKDLHLLFAQGMSSTLHWWRDKTGQTRIRSSLSSARKFTATSRCVGLRVSAYVIHAFLILAQLYLFNGIISSTAMRTCQ
jgi:hypothetical protein